jgi:dolichol-phosphate mannosyltransferase
MKIALLIPTYNEAENISRLLPLLASVSQRNTDIDLTVYVIDDSSPDGTSLRVSEIAPIISSANFKVQVIERPTKNGLGEAYIDGFKKVLKDKTLEYAIQMDADLSHDPNYLDYFFSYARKHTELVIGSRYIRGGAVPDWSIHRKLISKFGNLYARTLLGNKVTDYTGGYNMFSAELLQRLDFSKLNTSGYGFLISLKFHAVKACRSIDQIPIVFVDRKSGISKMPLNTMAKNFMLVLNLWLKK